MKVESEPKKSVSANGRSNEQIVASSEELKLSKTESEYAEHYINVFEQAKKIDKCHDMDLADDFYSDNDGYEFDTDDDYHHSRGLGGSSVDGPTEAGQERRETKGPVTLKDG